MLRHLRNHHRPTRPALSAVVGHGMLPPHFTNRFFMSTETRPDPAVKAKSIIDSLPGNNIVSKTALLTIGTGATAFAISKEIYVFNEETMVLVSFIGIATILYRNMKLPFVEWSTGRIESIKKILTQARADHQSAVTEKIESVSEMADVVDITKTMFAMSKEMAKLESEAFELQQRTAFVSEMKSSLDAWVRHETMMRERQQKQLADHVLAKLHASLADPKFQMDIINQCISDIEHISVNKA